MPKAVGSGWTPPKLSWRGEVVMTVLTVGGFVALVAVYWPGFPPIWMLLLWPLATSMLGTIPLVRRMLRRLPVRYRRALGRCGRCGYDLRMTPDRCPECGRVPLGKRARPAG